MKIQLYSQVELFASKKNGEDSVLVVDSGHVE
jgi:hypothetical protein